MSEKPDPASVNSRVYTKLGPGSIQSRGERPVETVLLDLYREALSGRILEVGSGSGRLSARLVKIATELHGIDISEEMVNACRVRCPEGDFRQLDMRQLGAHPAAPFDAVIAPFNVIDAVGATDRSRTLAGIHRVLRERGLLIMSSHNRAFSTQGPVGEVLRRASARDFRGTVGSLARLPVRVMNHQRLRRLEYTGTDHELRTDVGLDFGLIHYYTARSDQEQRLDEHGFKPLSCFDLEGNQLEPGDQAPGCPELHYVARKAPR